jgi:hypothetical protein
MQTSDALHGSRAENPFLADGDEALFPIDARPVDN